MTWSKHDLELYTSAHERVGKWSYKHASNDSGILPQDNRIGAFRPNHHSPLKLIPYSFHKPGRSVWGTLVGKRRFLKLADRQNSGVHLQV